MEKSEASNPNLSSWALYPNHRTPNISTPRVASHCARHHVSTHAEALEEKGRGLPEEDPSKGTEDLPQLWCKQAALIPVFPKFRLTCCFGYISCRDMGHEIGNWLKITSLGSSSEPRGRQAGNLAFQQSDAGLVTYRMLSARRINFRQERMMHEQLPSL